MKIAKIADTNLSQELNNFFESRTFQLFEEITDFFTSDELKKMAELCEVQKLDRNLPINVKLQECENITIKDIVELNFINLFEESEKKIEACIRLNNDYLFPSVAEMWRRTTLEYSKIEHANYNEVYCFEHHAIKYKRLFFLIAENEQFIKLFKIEERINKKLENEANYQEFLKKQFKS